MIERTDFLTTAEGTMEVFSVRPDGDGPFPVVVQLMDGLGMREEIRDHARRTASMGYYVLSPDLFYRAGVKGPLIIETPEGMEIIQTAMRQVTNARAISDVQLALQLAAGDAAANAEKIGVYGFCMGGRLTLVVVQALGERAAAGAAIHPGGLVTEQPDSPHRHVDKIKASLYFGIADKDRGATPAQMAQLETALKAADLDYQLEWHPGALHGYMMPSRGDIHDAQAAEKVWKRLEDLFGRCLS